MWIVQRTASRPRWRGSSDGVVADATQPDLGAGGLADEVVGVGRHHQVDAFGHQGGVQPAGLEPGGAPALGGHRQAVAAAAVGERRRGDARHLVAQAADQLIGGRAERLLAAQVDDHLRPASMPRWP
jgi:hypothetical protein